MFNSPAEMPLPAFAPAATRQPRAAERRCVELLVRYACKGLRATAMLKDLTRMGGRIEGVGALRPGDGMTLLLPGLKATWATVAWSRGSAAGLSFEDALDPQGYAALITDFAAPPPPHAA